MIAPMPRPRPPHLQKHRTRHGKVLWYVRIGKGPREPLKAPYGSPEFIASYHAAVAKLTATEPAKTGSGTLRWLWAQYRQSGAWVNLSLATRRQRENIMRGVLEKVGDELLSAFTRKAIVKSRDARSATPAMARHFVETMRGIFRWAVDAEHVDDDPTRDVLAPKPKTDGHHTWTVEEIAVFERRWRIGTRERLAFDLLLYTGLRRGDVARLGRQHVKDGVIAMRTAKTGESATVFMMPGLVRSIAAGPCGELSFIVGDHGRPMSKEGFGNWFGEICRATGVPGRAHGLRKALASKIAEAGASEAELDALFAWRGGGMAALYTRKASREKLARAAMARLGEENETGASYAQTSFIEAQTEVKSK